MPGGCSGTDDLGQVSTPHIVDPKNPGAVDEIIYLGDFWDEIGIRAHKTEIIKLNKEIGRLFERAYRYLRAAKALYDDWEAANLEGMNFGLANQIADRIIYGLLDEEPVSETVGKDRHLFASAITPDGMVNYLDTIIEPCGRKYIIEGGPGTGKSTLLCKVARAALERGFDAELYHCPLNPEKIEHVVIPELSVALTKSIEPHTYTPAAEDIIVDMNECLDPGVVDKNASIVEESQRLFEELFDSAIKFISRAKGMHDLMESYYTPYMDFAGIEALRRKTLQRILHYADEAAAGLV